MANIFRRQALGELTAAFARMGRPSTARARRGLYAGKDVLFGNMVSHSNRKTRRMFKPNAQRKRVWSDALQEMVPFNLTTTTLRMIDKVGGLDNYLLQTPEHKLDSESGMQVKKRIEKALSKAGAQEAGTQTHTQTPPPPQGGLNLGFKGIGDLLSGGGGGGGAGGGAGM